MPRAVNIEKASQSRVFIIEDRAGPGQVPSYNGLARAGAVSWPQGDITPIRVPSDTQYGQFDIIDRIRGQQGLPSMPIEFRRTREISNILKLVRKGCPIDVQVHIGACKTPTDFNEGWELIIVLEGATPTEYGTSDLGAFDADQEGPVIETVPFSGIDYYEIKPILPGEVAGAELVQAVVGVAICDSVQCGECGITSNGCEKIFAVTLSAGGSPGLPAEVVYSNDGGATWADTNVTTLGASEDPDGIACVGSNLVVISSSGEEVHYAATADVLEGTESWVAVSTGIVAAHGPTALSSINRTTTWMVGLGGYVYFSDDITSGFDVQDAGTNTTEDLAAINAYDELVAVAVGDNNVVLVTENGGSTWASVTGPSVGVDLTAVWAKSKTEWFVGTAGGELYYTRNSGNSWTLKAFPSSGSGSIGDIKFSNNTVGYMSHSLTVSAQARGRILRTIDGGSSWYVLPEGAISMPVNDSIDALAACAEDPNIVFGGGLADNGTDGFLVKLA